MAIFKSPRYDRFFYLTDGGMMVAPLWRKGADCENAVQVAHKLKRHAQGGLRSRSRGSEPEYAGDHRSGDLGEDERQAADQRDASSTVRSGSTMRFPWNPHGIRVWGGP